MLWQYYMGALNWYSSYKDFKTRRIFNYTKNILIAIVLRDLFVSYNSTIFTLPMVASILHSDR